MKKLLAGIVIVASVMLGFGAVAQTADARSTIRGPEVFGQHCHNFTPIPNTWRGRLTGQFTENIYGYPWVAVVLTEKQMNSNFNGNCVVFPSWTAHSDHFPMYGLVQRFVYGGGWVSCGSASATVPNVSSPPSGSASLAFVPPIFQHAVCYEPSWPAGFTMLSYTGGFFDNDAVGGTFSLNRQLIN